VAGDDGGTALANLIGHDGLSRMERMLESAQQEAGIPGAALHVLDALPRFFLVQPGREFRVLFHGFSNRRFGDPWDRVGVVQKSGADHNQLAG
jgi:hypothetical protein